MLVRAYRARDPRFPRDPAYLGAWAANDPGGTHANWVVMFDGGRPLSALRLFYREATASGGGSVRFGGIGNVGTDPKLGGRGLASRVMDAAHERLRREGVPIALLVTDIPDFYRRLGYESVRQRELFGTLATAGHPATPPRDRARPDATPSSVLATPSGAGPPRVTTFTLPPPGHVMTAHAASACESPGRVVRSLEYWTRWIGFKLQRPDCTAYTDGSAYAIVRREDEGTTCRILEGAGPVGGLAELVAAVSAGARSLKSPDEPLMHALFDRMGAEVSRRTRTGIMALALAPGAPGPEAFETYLELDSF
jgi:GNAT superfamily N-acetyltransferase